MNDKAVLLRYPYLGLPTAVSDSWDALYWIGDRRDGAAEHSLIPAVYAPETTGPNLVRASADANAAVEFTEVRAVHPRAVDRDGAAARALAVLTDPAALSKVAVSSDDPDAIFPHITFGGTTIVLYRPLRLIAFRWLREGDFDDDTKLVGVPVRDNNLVDWSRSKFIDFDTVDLLTGADHAGALGGILAMMIPNGDEPALYR